MDSKVFEDCVNNIENIRDLFCVIQVFHIQTISLLEKINNKLDQLIKNEED